MKLSERERDILACIQHRAGQPVRTFAKMTGYREHTIRYVMKQLIDREIILGHAPFINMYPLGYTGYTLFFSLATSDIEQQNKALETLIHTPLVSWAAKLGGTYEYAVAVVARRIEDVSDIFESLSAQFGNIFLDKSLLITKRFTAFERKYLSPELPAAPELVFGRTDAEEKIDDLDHRILSRMSASTYTSHRELARRMGLTHSTLERRLKGLKEKRIISGYIYRFDLSSLGMQTYRLTLSVRGISKEISASLYRFAAQHPNVLRFMETMGAWDFELEVEVPFAEDVTEIVKQLHSEFGAELQSVQLFQIFRHLKYSSYPLMGFEEGDRAGDIIGV